MRTASTTAAALLLAGLALPLAPIRAEATSCVAVEATPAELLRGAPMYGQPGATSRLFDEYDHALVGTVTAVRATGTDETGPYRVDVDVLAAFNRPSTTSRVTLSMPDRGQMLGYPFEVGGTYFVVVRDAQVGLCGPTQPLEPPDGALGTVVTELRAAARAGGVRVSVPGEGDPAAPAPRTAAPAAPSGTAPATPLALGGAAALALAGGAMAAVRRTRGRRQG